MSALFAAALNAFKGQGWHCRQVPDMEVLESDFEAHHAKVPLHVQVYGDAHLVNIVATASFQVPTTHRSAAAELLMRTNHELNVGNFEMVWDSGMVVFRISNVFPPHRYDERVLAGLVHTAVAEMDRMTPFLGEVCRTPKGELLLLNIPDLLKRQDLLPPAPEPAAQVL